MRISLRSFLLVLRHNYRSPRGIDCSAPQTVCHVKMKKSYSMPFSDAKKQTCRLSFLTPFFFELINTGRAEGANTIFKVPGRLQPG